MRCGAQGQHRLAHLLIFELLAVHERQYQPHPLEGHKLLGGAALLHQRCAPIWCECQGHDELAAAIPAHQEALC